MRFSIRALLIVTIFVAIGAAWFRIEHERRKRIEADKTTIRESFWESTITIRSTEIISIPAYDLRTTITAEPLCALARTATQEFGLILHSDVDASAFRELFRAGGLKWLILYDDGLSEEAFHSLTEIGPEPKVRVGSFCDRFDFAAVMNSRVSALYVFLTNLASLETIEDSPDNDSLEEVTIDFRGISADMKIEHYELMNRFARSCRRLKRLDLILDEVDSVIFEAIIKNFPQCELTIEAYTTAGFAPPANLSSNITVYLEDVKFVDKKVHATRLVFPKDNAIGLEQYRKSRTQILMTGIP